MKDVSSARSQPGNHPRLPSLDLAFDLAREQLSIQREQAAGLDSKASFVLGSASLLTAATAALRGTTSDLPSHTWVNILAILSVIVFAIIVGSAYQAYSLKSFQEVPNLARLQEYYVGAELQETKGVLLSTMVEAYQKNERSIARKIRWTQVALLGLVGEAIMLGSITLIQVIR